MTLSEFLAAMTTSKIVVTVLNSDNTQLIKMYAGGQSALDATLLAREVAEFSIGAGTVDIKLAAAQEQQSTEPAQSGDPAETTEP